MIIQTIEKIQIFYVPIYLINFKYFTNKNIIGQFIQEIFHYELKEYQIRLESTNFDQQNNNFGQQLPFKP